MTSQAEQDVPDDLGERVDSALRAFWRGDSSALEHLLNTEDAGEEAGLGKLLGGLIREQAGPVVGLPSQSEVGGYKIIREIGRGGMGVVYEAEQQEPRRRVALKVLRGLEADEYHVKLFRREIQALARLRHPGIATIYEAGHTPDGQHFFTMELVTGTPLSAWARNVESERAAPATGPSEPEAPARDPAKCESGPGAQATGPARRPIDEILRLFIPICEAVQYAHEHGVIHRDLKPSNIMVDAEGHVRILDFGLARIIDVEATLATRTAEHGFAGTLAYMSPEQAAGDSKAIDLRSDVYALGVILYELLTGQLPCDLRGRGSVGVSPADAIRVIREQPPRKPSSTLGWDGRPARHLRGDLETILLKALEKEAVRRYLSVAEFTADVQRFLRAEPIRARPASGLYVARKRLSKHRRWIALGAAALALVLAGIGLALWSHQRTLEAKRRSTMYDALVQARQGKYQVAIEQYTLLVNDPRAAADRACQYYHRAHAHLCLREYSLTISDYTKAAEHMRPDQRAWCLYRRATPLWIVGRGDKAAADYREYRKLRPDVSYADALLFLVLRDQARILSQSGRGVDAGRRVQEAGDVLAAARRTAAPGSWLGKILECLAGECTPDGLVDTVNPNKAEQRCEAYYYAGEACLVAGQFDEARVWFKRCVETGLVFDPDTYPPDPMTEYHLALWRLDQLADASTDGRPPQSEPSAAADEGAVFPLVRDSHLAPQFAGFPACHRGKGFPSMRVRERTSATLHLRCLAPAAPIGFAHDGECTGRAAGLPCAVPGRCLLPLC